MHANVGDRIVIKGHRVGDTGHETLFFPGSDATLEHRTPVSTGTPAA